LSFFEPFSPFSPSSNQGLAAIARSSTPNETFPEFFDWYFDYLRNHSSATTGYWEGKTTDKVRDTGRGGPQTR
jgi:hypothetical protein